MATLVPNVNLSTVLGLLQLIPLLNTNFQAVNTALNERVVGHRISVTRYSATGSTVTKMTLGSVSPPGSTPWGVILVRARESSNPASDLPVMTRVNFTQQGETLYIFEPQGLVANTFYDLDFLVLE
jgi:hypothetical protein